MHPGGNREGRWETEVVATVLLISELREDKSTWSSGRFITGTYWMGVWACSDVGPVDRRIISWFFQEMNHDFTAVQTLSLVTTPTELSPYALLYLNCIAHWHSVDVLQPHADSQGLRMCFIE